ncbi:pirin family protein [Lacibacterium aquatile]|uniref:Pirin family protein n=1 Tax=Lacibacterium aquatile TaxID=1168082 RepID=A0ABW5DXG5_9PROT
MTEDRRIQTVTPAFHTLEGEGFEVRRAIPTRAFEAVGPFIFLDHFGPIDVKPGDAKGAPTHPHAGIETLTLLLEGRFEHKDSLGNRSAMRPGEVQWMRAGRGIVHDEGPDQEIRAKGGPVHGVQLWLNMPKGQKHGDPAYRHVLVGEIPLIPTEQAGVRARLIAGEVCGAKGPIETTGTPFVSHVTIGESGADLFLPVANVSELALYVMVGSVRVGPDQRPVKAGEIARIGAGDALRISADGAADLLLVGGDPLDAPIVRYGPFVMNTTDELRQAVHDFQSGLMGHIAA